MFLGFGDSVDTRRSLWVIVAAAMLMTLGAGEATGQVKHGELPDWMRERIRKNEKPAPKSTPYGAPAQSPNSEATLLELYPGEQTAEEDEPSKAFALGTMINGRSIKPAAGAHLIRVGINSRIAPVRAVTKSQLDSYTASYPEMGQVVDLAQQVDLEQIESGTAAEIEAEFLAIEGLSDEERQAIESVDFASQQQAISTLVEVVNDPEEAITFSIEPFLNANFDVFGVTLFVPLAGFSHGSDATFEMGNLTLDGRFGHYEEVPGAVVGVSYGLSLSAPTGTERSDSVALSNMLDSPRFRHAYLGIEPYLGFGMDAKYIIIQMECGVSQLNRVRTAESPDGISYFRYGGAFSLVPFEVIALTFEVTGGANIDQAEAFNILQLTGSLRARIANTIEPVVGVMAPVAIAGQQAYGGTGDLAFGSPADINVFAGLSVAF